MMRAARTASLLLVAFCLLTSAASAHAECAWVLWKEEPIASNLLSLPQSLTFVFEQKKHCEEAVLIGYDKRIKDRERGVSVPEAFFTCLPDTVDPGAPKGGGR